MLILTRNLREIVMVGDDVQIIVLSINASNVSLGFKAPRHIPVNREEVYFRNQSFHLDQHKVPHRFYEFSNFQRKEMMGKKFNK